MHHLWVFESDQGLPGGDARVVVPNGRPKLIVPVKNALRARRAAEAESAEVAHGPGDPVLIGLWEEPSIIASSPASTCTIGVELLPHALTRFFAVSAGELRQRVVPLGEVLGAAGRALGQRVGEARTVDDALAEVQEFLVARLTERSAPQGLVESALGLLAGGLDERLADVQTLERRMGYSQRYLHALFVEHVGLPPKRLSSVLAFERLYRRFSQDKSVSLLREDALELFYDQSHFIRTFRRFTGHAPTRFAELRNEFGRIFYLPERGPGLRSVQSRPDVR